MFVEICSVGRQFDGLWAVRGLSTTLHPGSVVAVLGANGAGKSTLLRLLAGWLPLSEGSIRFDDVPFRPTAIRLRQRVMLLDEATRRDSLPVDVIGRQIKDYGADRAGIEDEVAQWFDALDITKVYQNRARNMSKGQWFKMAMVALFVVNSDIWLLDEPFSAGLDASGIQTLESQIRAHCESGGTVVFSSQWPDHARRLADRALVLHEGRLVWDAKPAKRVPMEYLDTADAHLRAVLQGLTS